MRFPSFFIKSADRRSTAASGEVGWRELVRIGLNDKCGFFCLVKSTCVSQLDINSKRHNLQEPKQELLQSQTTPDQEEDQNSEDETEVDPKGKLQVFQTTWHFY